MIFNVKRSFVGLQLHSHVLQSPSQDSILYYYQSDFCAPVCDLGTLGSLVRFFFHTEWLQNASQWPKMWREIIEDIYYTPKTFCSMKEDWGMWANFGPLVLNFRIWAEMKSNGHDITRNGFYDPENPWLHVSQLMFYENIKTSKCETSFGSQFGICPK